jgi:propionate CoA-transferase
VIVQVERIAGKGMLRQREVEIFGIMVDCVIIATKKGTHMQTFDVDYDPACR